MAYEFKKLSDVNAIEEMKDGLNILVEDDGEIVKLAADSMISNAIPVPETAQIGQTVVVKSVDENGKPTGWEAANVGAIVHAFYTDDGTSLNYDGVFPESGFQIYFDFAYKGAIVAFMDNVNGNLYHCVGATMPGDGYTYYWFTCGGSSTAIKISSNGEIAIHEEES